MISLKVTRQILAPLFFFLPVPSAAQFFGKMRGDRFAFAVRVRRQVDSVGALRQLLQLGEHFFFARNDDVFGREVVLDVDAKRLLGQIFNVAERGFDLVSRA